MNKKKPPGDGGSINDCKLNSTTTSFGEAAAPAPDEYFDMGGGPGAQGKQPVPPPVESALP